MMHESLSVAAVGYMLPENNKFSYLHIHSPFLYAYSINLVCISSLFQWGSKKSVYTHSSAPFVVIEEIG